MSKKFQWTQKGVPIYKTYISCGTFSDLYWYVSCCTCRTFDCHLSIVVRRRPCWRHTHCNSCLRCPLVVRLARSSTQKTSTSTNKDVVFTPGWGLREKRVVFVSFRCARGGKRCHPLCVRIGDSHGFIVLACWRGLGIVFLELLSVEEVVVFCLLARIECR